MKAKSVTPVAAAQILASMAGSLALNSGSWQASHENQTQVAGK